MLKNRKFMNIIVIIMWFVCGIFTISKGITHYDGNIPVVCYICIWACYLIELALKELE